MVNTHSQKTNITEDVCAQLCGHHLYVKQKCLSVCLFVCQLLEGELPRETGRGRVDRKEGGNWEGDFYAEGDGEGGQVFKEE